MKANDSGYKYSFLKPLKKEKTSEGNLLNDSVKTILPYKYFPRLQEASHIVGSIYFYQNKQWKI